MVVMSYLFTAKRWAHGWELQHNGATVTQVRTLHRAEQQARDWISTIEERDTSADQVEVVPQLEGDLLAEVAAARDAVRAAADAQVAAARRMRAVAGRLRGQGLSVSDTAHVLGVSRGRVSQLTDV